MRGYGRTALRAALLVAGTGVAVSASAAGAVGSPARATDEIDGSLHSVAIAGTYDGGTALHLVWDGSHRQ
jgi:hypothetical protein